MAWKPPSTDPLVDDSQSPASGNTPWSPPDTDPIVPDWQPPEEDLRRAAPVRERVAGKLHSDLLPDEAAELSVLADPDEIEKLHDENPQLPLTEVQQRVLFNQKRARGIDVGQFGGEFLAGLGQTLASAGRGAIEFAQKGSINPARILQPQEWSDARQAWESVGSGVIDNVAALEEQAVKAARGGTRATDALKEVAGFQDEEQSFKNFQSRLDMTQAAAEDRLRRPQRGAAILADLARAAGADNLAEVTESGASAPSPDIATAAGLVSPIDPTQFALLGVGKLARAAGATDALLKAGVKVRVAAGKTLERTGSAAEKIGGKMVDVGKGAVRLANAAGEKIYGVPGAPVPGTGVLSRAVATPLILAGKPAEAVGGVLRSVGAEMGVEKVGRRGVLESAGKSAKSSAVAQRLLGGARGRVADWLARNGKYVVDKGIQGAVLGPLMGFADIEDMGDAARAAGSGFASGVVNAATDYSEENALRHRRYQDADVDSAFASMDPATRENLTSLTSFDRQVDLARQRAAALAIRAMGPKATEADARAAASAATQRDMYERANSQTRDEYERQMRIAIADVTQLANGVARGAGLKNVNILALPESEITRLVIERNPGISPRDARNWAASMGFTDEVASGEAPAFQIDPAHPTAVINIDRLWQRMQRGDFTSLQHTLAHEVFHGLEQIPEVQAAIEPLQKKLFATEVAAPDGTRTVVGSGLTQEDLVKMYLENYAGGMDPKKALDRFRDADKNVDFARVADYMRREVLSEVMGLQPSNMAGSLMDDLRSPLRGFIDWARASESNSAAGRSIALLRKLGVDVTGGNVKSKLLGLNLTSDQVAAARDALRNIERLDGDLSPAVGYSKDPSPVTAVEIAANPALRERYKDSGLFETEIVAVVRDAAGNETSRVPVDQMKVNEGSWVRRGGKLSQVGGNPAAAPGIRVPEGSSVTTERHIAMQPDGVTPKILSDREIERRARERDTTIREAIENAPDDGSPNRLSDEGQGWRGVLSPSQLSAIMALPDSLVAPSLKSRIREFNDALANRSGTRFLIDYQAASGRKGKYRSLAPRIRDVIPIGFHFSKQGNFLVTTISVSRLFDKLNAWSARLPERLRPWGGDRRLFWEDLQTYLSNQQSRVPGETGLDDDPRVAEQKKNILNDFFNLYTKDTEGLNPSRTRTPGTRKSGARTAREEESNVDRTIMSARLDRITAMERSNAEPMPIDYGRLVANLLPSEQVLQQMPDRVELIDLPKVTPFKTPKPRREGEMWRVGNILASKEPSADAAAMIRGLELLSRHTGGQDTRKSASQVFATLRENPYFKEALRLSQQDLRKRGIKEVYRGTAVDRNEKQLTRAVKSFSESAEVANALSEAAVDDNDKLSPRVISISAKKYPLLTNAALEAVAEKLGVNRSDQPHTQYGHIEMNDAEREVFVSPSTMQPDIQFLPVEPGFYSQLERVIEEKMPRSASVDQVRSLLGKWDVVQDFTKPDGKSSTRVLGTFPLDKSDEAQALASKSENARLSFNSAAGVKPEEIKWSGIEEWLEGKTKVSKEELTRYLQDEGRTQFVETRLRDNRSGPWERYDDLSQLSEDGDLTLEEADEFMRLGNEVRGTRAEDQTKFSSYVLPGGANYREIVFSIPHDRSSPEIDELGRKYDALVEEATLNYGGELTNWPNDVKREVKEAEQLMSEAIKQKESAAPTYTSSHYSDVPNYNGHMRLDDRVDAEGRPGLFIEELQNDRHQAGREKGYKGGKRTAEEIDAELKELPEGDPREAELIQETGALNHGVPDAPFRKDWPLQLFKRALREAVETGKEWIGWTSGDTQAERYDLSKHVDAIHSWPDGEISGEPAWGIQVMKGRTVELEDQSVPQSKLEGLVGKDIANRIIQREGETPAHDATVRTLSGDGLKVGGEGMRGFYDKILPSEIGKYVKKWGAKVEEGSVPTKDYEKTNLELSEDGKSIIDRSTGETIEGPFDSFIDADDRLGELQNSENLSSEAKIHKIMITPQMRESVEQGQPQFMPDLSKPATLKQWAKKVEAAKYWDPNEKFKIPHPPGEYSKNYDWIRKIEENGVPGGDYPHLMRLKSGRTYTYRGDDDLISMPVMPVGDKYLTILSMDDWRLSDTPEAALQLVKSKGGVPVDPARIASEARQGREDAKAAIADAERIDAESVTVPRADISNIRTLERLEIAPTDEQLRDWADEIDSENRDLHDEKAGYKSGEAWLSPSGEFVSMADFGHNTHNHLANLPYGSGDASAMTLDAILIEKLLGHVYAPMFQRGWRRIVSNKKTIYSDGWKNETRAQKRALERAAEERGFKVESSVAEQTSDFLGDDDIASWVGGDLGAYLRSLGATESEIAAMTAPRDQSRRMSTTESPKGPTLIQRARAIPDNFTDTTPQLMPASRDILERGTRQHLEFWNRALENSGISKKPTTLEELDSFIRANLKNQHARGYDEIFPKPDKEKIKAYYQRVVRDAPIEEAAEFPPDWIALRRMSQREFDARFSDAAVKKITQERAESLAATANYLLGEESYSPAEVAQIINSARKIRVLSRKNEQGDLVPVEQKITSGNEAVPNEISGATAARIVERMRNGESSDAAFVQGVFEGMRAASDKKEGKSGWKKYDQSQSREAAETLNNDLASTNWCTGGSVGTAQSHLSGGDFYVYFKDGDPQIAIRTDNGVVAEIRGRGKGQTIDDAELRQDAESFLRSGIGPSGGDDYLSDQDFRRAAVEYKKTGVLPEYAYRFFGQDGVFIPQKPRSEEYGESSFEKEYVEAYVAATLDKSKVFRNGVLATSLNYADHDPNNSRYSEVRGEVFAEHAKNLSLPALTQSGSIFADNTRSLSLPALTQSGDIYANTSESLDLPSLTQSGNIRADNAKSISLPALTQSRSIVATNTKVLDLPALTQSKDIVTSAKSLSLPALTQSRDIYAGVESLNLPALTRSRDIVVHNAKNLNLPSLTQSGKINADSAESLDLPALAQSENIYAKSAKSLNLPALTQSGKIYAASAKQKNIGGKVSTDTTPQFMPPDTDPVLEDDGAEEARSDSAAPLSGVRLPDMGLPLANTPAFMPSGGDASVLRAARNLGRRGDREELSRLLRLFPHMAEDLRQAYRDGEAGSYPGREAR